MKAEKPILFSTAMVAAILKGSKTQTRRIIKNEIDHQIVDDGVISKFGKCPQGKPGAELWVRESWRIVGWRLDDGEMLIEYRDGTKKWCELYDPDDCGTWIVNYIVEMERRGVIAVPDDYDVERDGEEFQYNFIKPFPWKPSIHMPRCASRIQLEIIDVRPEPLQAISKSSIINEGVIETGNSTPPNYDRKAKQYAVANRVGFETAHAAFRWLWESINGSESWHANPWVWVIEFKIK